MTGGIVRDVLGGSSPLRVVGLDISLTSTGMSDGRRTEVVQTSPKDRIEERMDRITRGVVSFVLAYGGADLAVIEWSSYGSHGGEELAALRYMALVRLWRLHVPVARVAPSTLKLYVAGQGRASKAQMVAAVDARYGRRFADVKASHGRDDMADAFGLAVMGYAQAGHPIPDEATAPAPISSAKVDWPFLYADD